MSGARWLGGALAVLALLSLGLLLGLLAADAAGELGRGAGGATLILSDSLTPADHETMLEREAEAVDPHRFALWTERTDQWLEAPELLRSTGVSVLPVLGDTRLVLPLAAGLHEEDLGGCLIDQHTARALFGSADAVGAVLRWNGRELTVRGVFAAPRAALLVRPVGAELPLDRVSVDGADASLFAMRQGLLVSVTVSGRVLHESALLLSRWPLLLAAWLLAAWLFRMTRRSYGLPVRTALCCTAALAASTAVFLLALRLLPSPLVPSRWSDFAHWGSALQGARDAAAGWFSAAWYRPDRRQLLLLARSGLGILSGWCLLLALRRGRRGGGRR